MTQEIETHPGGRPEFCPTIADRDWVTKAATSLVPQEIIAAQVVNPDTGEGITAKTLRKHFSQELNEGLYEVAQKLTAAAYDVATNQNHLQFGMMNRFLCRTHLGMKDVTRTELTGADGGPLETPRLQIVMGSHASQSGAE